MRGIGRDDLVLRQAYVAEEENGRKKGQKEFKEKIGLLPILAVCAGVLV